MRLSVAMRLARVSNLPTVWTNVVAGLVLAGAAFTPMQAGLLMLALSFFYTGGMVLNDYFDREIDARERAERPIPAGETTAASALVLGVGLLIAGEGIVAAQALGPNGMGPPPIAAGALLAGLIVLYDLKHKQNPLSPLLMALCRVLVYVTAALSVAPDLGLPLLGGCTMLLIYLAALTWIAKQEGRGRIRAPIGVLVAGISFVDAAMVLAQGQPALALLCAAAFPLTLLFQRRISGT